MANLRSGFGVLEEAVKKSKAAFVPTTGKLNYFGLEDGEVMFVRFLDDNIVTTKFYEFLLNNQGGKTEFICAPDLYKLDPDWRGQDWVKKWMSPTPGIGWAEDYKTKAIVEPKLKEKTVGIAVKQELDPDKPGTIQDVLEPVEVDGENHISLHFILVKQSLQNFWDQMVGYYSLYGTICDRPYRIERRGEQLKTTYHAIGMDKDPDWNNDGSSLAALQAYYGYGVKVKKADGDEKDPAYNVDAENPEGYTWANRYLYCPITVAEWAERRASEEFAEFWLNPNAEHLEKKAAGVTPDALLATQRPVDPRQAQTSAPVVSTATGVPVTHQQAVPPPPAPEGNKEFHPDTTSNPESKASAPAAPITGDRFEAMRQEMAERQKTVAK